MPSKVSQRVGHAQFFHRRECLPADSNLKTALFAGREDRFVRSTRPGCKTHKLLGRTVRERDTRIPKSNATRIKARALPSAQFAAPACAEPPPFRYLSRKGRIAP